MGRPLHVRDHFRSAAFAVKMPACAGPYSIETGPAQAGFHSGTQVRNVSSIDRTITGIQNIPLDQQN